MVKLVHFPYTIVQPFLSTACLSVHDAGYTLSIGLQQDREVG